MKNAAFRTAQFLTLTAIIGIVLMVFVPLAAGMGYIIGAGVQSLTGWGDPAIFAWTWGVLCITGIMIRLIIPDR